MNQQELKGKSELKAIDSDSGKVLRRKKTDEELFNEGISIVNDTLYQLTWKDSVLVIYDTLFNEKYRIFNPIEGWGICSNDDKLYISNGTNMIIAHMILFQSNI